MKVFGVWIGKHEPELAYLFSTRTEAEQYVRDYNRWDVAVMNKHLRQQSEEFGTSLREWEPQAYWAEHTVHDSALDADARIYEMIARDLTNG